MPFTCVVPGCFDMSSTRHRFPHPNKASEKFKAWLQAVQNDSLNNIEAMKVYSNYRICHRHFSAKHLSTNMYLTIDAIPTLFLSPKNIIQKKFEALPCITPTKEPKLSTDAELPTLSRTTTYPAPSILQEVGVKRITYLTPKAQKIYKRTRSLSKSVHKLRLRTRRVRHG